MKELELEKEIERLRQEIDLLGKARGRDREERLDSLLSRLVDVQGLTIEALRDLGVFLPRNVAIKLNKRDLGALLGMSGPSDVKKFWKIYHAISEEDKRFIRTRGEDGFVQMKGEILQLAKDRGLVIRADRSNDDIDRYFYALHRVGPFKLLAWFFKSIFEVAPRC